MIDPEIKEVYDIEVEEVEPGEYIPEIGIYKE
jgi:hypothetical protein